MAAACRTTRRVPDSREGGESSHGRCAQQNTSGNYGVHNRGRPEDPRDVDWREVITETEVPAPVHVTRAVDRGVAAAGVATCTALRSRFTYSGLFFHY
jgi:hypothetical protein